MDSPTVFELRGRTYVEEYAPQSLGDDHANFEELPGSRNRAARGALVGVLLGAGFWGAILVLVGVIKR